MPSLERVLVQWSNFAGAPGIGHHYFMSGTTNKCASLRAFYAAAAAAAPNNTQIQVNNVGDIIDVATGLITGGWSEPAVAVFSAGGTGAYAGPAGAVVHWLSTAVVAGRRLRGRTFIVPLVNTVFDTSGSLASSYITTLQNAADALVSATLGNYVVYHRPTAAGNDGASGQIYGARVPDLAAVLRSRRT